MGRALAARTTIYSHIAGAHHCEVGHTGRFFCHRLAWSPRAQSRHQREESGHVGRQITARWRAERKKSPDARPGGLGRVVINRDCSAIAGCPKVGQSSAPCEQARANHGNPKQTPSRAPHHIEQREAERGLLAAGLFVALGGTHEHAANAAIPHADAIRR